MKACAERVSQRKTSTCGLTVGTLKTSDLADTYSRLVLLSQEVGSKQTGKEN